MATRTVWLSGFALACAGPALPPAPAPAARFETRPAGEHAPPLAPAPSEHDAAATKPPALFVAHPELSRALPHVSLCALPTPVVESRSLAARLGIRSLWVKRDDLASPVYGGGKARKLEWLLGEARRAEAIRIVTIGAAGSNQAVATAAFASELGLSATLLLVPERPAEHVRRNLLASHALGAELRAAHSMAAANALARRLVAEGSTYLIAPGGSTPLGNVAFVSAAYELKAQVDSGLLPPPDFIYLPLGTMGSAIGLLVGALASGLPGRIIAVRVSSVPTSTRAAAVALFDATVRFLRDAEPSFPLVRFDDARFEIEGRFLGAGYAAPTDSAKRAMTEYAAHLDHALEPVYTGKSFAALRVRAPLHPDAVHLFWNTHSSAAPRGDGVDPASLPRAFHAYFPRAGRTK